MNDRIFNLIFDQEEVNWQTILMELVKAEGMDPWNIDVSDIANKYIDVVRKLRETNLRISGKVILASALLLAVKSKRLLGKEIDELDRLLAQSKDTDEYGDFEDVDLLQPYPGMVPGETRKMIFPRTPQPRKRKVSIYDLVEALQKAMKVRNRRLTRKLPDAKQKINIPDTVDITEVIVKVYTQIKDYFSGTSDKLTFSKLLPAEDRQSKVFTFIPLLHLENERRINLSQQRDFGEIEIEMLRKTQKLKNS
jgi:segregation and condensation protein A